MRPARAVLFDLDGTLVDSAPDLVGAALDVAQSLAVEPQASPIHLRAQVSKGARALLTACLPPSLHPGMDAHVASLLALYEARNHAQTVLFAGVSELLHALDRSAIPWGIVTNKPGWLTDQVLCRLDLGARARAIVCGDTLPVRKPDPAPVLHALGLMGLPPEGCVFVGDDLRDVQAGSAAGVPVLVAAWGYVDPGEDLLAWHAHALVSEPRGLGDFLLPP